MNMITRLTTLLIMFGAVSCTPILVKTTDGEGLQENEVKRSIGTIFDDESIQTRVAVNLRSLEPALTDSHIDIFAYNGVVLLVGQVPSEQLKGRATDIAATASSKIKRIHNELEVSGKTGFLTRSSDAWISTKVRTQLLADTSVPADQIKVISENGSIYLMGLVNQQQGDNAAALARNVSGVTRVVKVFEYVN